MTQAAAILIRDCSTEGSELDREERQAERALIERAKADAGAYGQLYRSHYTAIAGYLFRRTGDEHAAEDLASETFLSAWKALPRYRDRGAPFRAWLMRIATNKANRWSKARKKELRQLARFDQAIGRLSVQAADEAEQSGVNTALLSLAERDQTVLVLHHVEGMSVEQVGRVMGLRVGTVKSRLSRARDRLREELNQGQCEQEEVSS
ncbi:MAG: RNA polymerase sigma factor (sigma-70 family) [Phycisphaerales bacterium]|jgi:RNA polymerase sigma factor (sigma-70 family)